MDIPDDSASPASLLLRLTRDPHASLKTSHAAPEWQVSTYVLSGARGFGSDQLTVALGPLDVTELILADGSSLLASCDSLPRYLGTPSAAGNGAAPLIEVGQALRPSGPRLPPGASGDGVGAWMLKALRIYRGGGSGMTALAAAGAFQDRQLDHRLGLYRCATERWELTPAAPLAPAREPLLLLLHGSASSTERCFRGLWDNGLGPQLAALYGNRIYGYEHRTLSEGPIHNALELVRLLPQGALLHVLSHGSGGLVGELLARAQRSASRGAADLAGDGIERLSENTVGGEPFNRHDIDHFTSQAMLTGRLGYAADAARLEQLNLELKSRAIRIERFVRVACPARGSTLVSGRLERWASVMFNLLGSGATAAPPRASGEIVDAGASFFLALVQQRCDARLLPGIEAMMPDSPLVALLNAPDVRIDASLHVLAGDCSGHGLLKWLGDSLSGLDYGGQSDLLVNSASMSGGAARQPPLRQVFLRGPHVHHLNYFERPHSAALLLRALAGVPEVQFQPLAGIEHGAVARGGEAPKRRDGAPIVLLLPGVMGSHLQVGNSRVWFDPVNLVEGQIERLAVGQPHIVSAGWVEPYYEPFAQFLAQSHEVRPFTYDWRLSLLDSGAAFETVLDAAMDDAERRGQPLRIVGHGMGGLLARWALRERWPRFTAISGSRLLQVGTPNRGTHAMAAVLLGRDELVQMLISWIGWKHTARQFLGFIRAFPGVLEMLPWPADGQTPLANDGIDYFDPATWKLWQQDDREAGLANGWHAPLAAALQQARSSAALIAATPLNARHTSYLAGCAATPLAVRVRAGRLEIAYGIEGDGRVAWDGGIPAGIKAWYVAAAHGDLLRQQALFPAYRQLLENGHCTQLADSPPNLRGKHPPQFHAREPEAFPLFPTPQETLAAAIGGARPSVPPPLLAAPRVTLEIIHGSMASADAPVMTGSYAYESLRGSMTFLDRLLDGRLQEIHALGRYPQRPDEALVVLQPELARRPGGAIVIGLGALGELTPGELTRAFAGGLLEYACVREQLLAAGQRNAPCPPSRQEAAGHGTDSLRVASLLSGSGYGGLSIALCIRSLIDGVRSANRRLEDAGLRSRIHHISIYEQSEARAIAAAIAIEQVMCETRYQSALHFDRRIKHSPGGYRRVLPVLSGDNGWRRVHIVAADLSGALRFTLVTDRAHNSVDEEPNQRQAVDGLIMDATDNTTDQPGLSRALYELMLPNGLKAAIPEMRGLILAVDQSAAIYPWELMRDEADREESPLSTRIGMVRQLASPRELPRGISPASNSVLVVGDTDSGLAELPAAQAEAQQVARMFGASGYHVVDLYRPKAQQVLVHLFDEKYFAIHLAGHGEVEGASTPLTGLVLGPKTRLTAAQISKLKRVPQFVFINCCHLGDMRPDAAAPWSKLAANLATAFIEMGSQAVIAAGWRIDDQAASTFARSFYKGMMSGEYFGDAVRLAREATFLGFPASNTWGAYQAYGDDRYRFPNTETKQWLAPDYHYHGQLLADLETLHARIAGADAARRKSIQDKVGAIEESARLRFYGYADIREKMADTRAGLGGIDNTLRAIEHYRAAQSATDGQVSMRALERLATLEVRQGAALLGIAAGDAVEQPAEPAQGAALMDSGRRRLELLIELAPTAQRLSLLGEYWKLQARLARLHGAPAEAALLEMTAAYRRALDESALRSGSADYEIVFNALAGAFLLKAAGHGDAWSVLHPVLADVLQSAIANAHQRYAEERKSADICVEVQGALIATLWACYEAPPTPASSVFGAAQRDQIIALYHDALRRFGSIGEPEALLLPVRFMLEMMPPGAPEGSLEARLRASLQAFVAQLPALA
ncbi:CHAT domain-containing protein [Janthinobacterium agaricidamnosum]|uniref:Proteophosphoglycan ppg4 n=1 Tax=Janthinobacterium agaricidamnosum NBRC 102515 = DSM 9628 TaxID=1349767 RepID=W0V980_9BURK|nr:CHAT domain-containing protein [Janthinobacterium agaricidamnosum]CDG83837.1 proteophosphoglycan ppg4 [Janthinobacterium agaricidamnosum NBRC 102515 = DSM 9628]